MVSFRGVKPRVPNELPTSVVVREEQGYRARLDVNDPMRGAVASENQLACNMGSHGQPISDQHLLTVPASNDQGHVRERMSVQERCAIDIADPVASNAERSNAEELKPFEVTFDVQHYLIPSSALVSGDIASSRARATAKFSQLGRSLYRIVTVRCPSPSL